MSSPWTVGSLARKRIRIPEPLGADTAERLDAIFDKYAKRAEEIKVEKWVRRPLGCKLKDRAAYSINELL